MVKEERLRIDTQFAAVYQRGKSWADRLVVLRTLPNGLDRNRHGYVTAKHIGKAVIRNRIRRKLREIVRLTSIKPGWDIVLTARKGAATADYSEMERAVTGLLRRAQVLEGTGRGTKDQGI